MELLLLQLVYAAGCKRNRQRWDYDETTLARKREFRRDLCSLARYIEEYAP